MTATEDGEADADQAPRPRVFVSYADDSAEHRHDVLRLCHLLIGKGVDARCDQWARDERRGWSEWAEAEVQAADYVLAVASPVFRRAGDGEPVGHEHHRVQAETALLRELLQQDRPSWRRRILPVLLPARSWTDIPVFLSPCNDTRFEVSAFTVEGAEELIRFLTRQPRYVPPAPGAAPHLPPYEVDGRPGMPAGRPRVAAAFGPVPVAPSPVPERAAPGRWPLWLILAAVVITVGTTATWPLWHRTLATGQGSTDVPGRDGTGASPAGPAGSKRQTLKISNNPITSDKDKLDLDTGCPGHGSQPQIIVHCGGLADLVLDPERLHTVDDDPRLLLVPGGGGTTNCSQALDRPGRLTGSIDLGDLPPGAGICLRTDQGAIGHVVIVDRSLSYPATLVIDWALR